MGFWPFGKKDKAPAAPELRVTENADGSRTVTTSFALSGEPRTAREDVLASMDDALGALRAPGTELLHAIDPRRILAWEEGGPAVWSVGLVEVAGARPYRLAMTYGFGSVLTPEPCRAKFRHEYSIAFPAEGGPEWAVALLRHLSRYVLTSGNELSVGDIMPCHAPITCVPFPPQYHAQMPDTALVGVVVLPDPVLGAIATPGGAIEVRRIVGITQAEIDGAFAGDLDAELARLVRRDALLLSDIART